MLSTSLVRSSSFTDIVYLESSKQCSFTYTKFLFAMPCRFPIAFPCPSNSLTALKKFPYFSEKINGLYFIHFKLFLFTILRISFSSDLLLNMNSFKLIINSQLNFSHMSSKTLFKGDKTISIVLYSKYNFFKTSMILSSTLQTFTLFVFSSTIL